MNFLLFLLLLFIGAVILAVYGLRDKSSRRPLTAEDRLYLTLMHMQMRQNDLEEERLRTERMRRY